MGKSSTSLYIHMPTTDFPETVSEQCHTGPRPFHNTPFVGAFSQVAKFSE